MALSLTACADMNLANVSHKLGNLTAKSAFSEPTAKPIELDEEQQALKQKLEPLVPELIKMAQGNPRVSVEDFQRNITTCLNPKYPLDLQYDCHHVRMMVINVVYETHKNKIPLSKKDKTQIQNTKKHNDSWINDMQLTGILTHRLDLYQKYIADWDIYQSYYFISQAQTKEEIDATYKDFRILSGILFADEPQENETKQLVFSELQQRCQRYISGNQADTSKSFIANMVGQGFESDCVVLGFNKTEVSETTQAYQKFKKGIQENNHIPANAVAQNQCLSMSHTEVLKSVNARKLAEYGSLLGAMSIFAPFGANMRQEAATATPRSPAEIRSMCQNLCSQKKGKACSHIGVAYESEENMQQAEKYFKQGCDYGDSNACFKMEPYYYKEVTGMQMTKPSSQTCLYENGMKISCEDNAGLFPITTGKTGAVKTLIKGRKPNKQMALRYRQKGLALLQKNCQKGNSTACRQYKKWANGSNLGDITWELD